MLSVLLTILKIIGIVLLVIIGIVLVVLLLVLFVPFRYEIHAQREGIPTDAKMTEGLLANAGVTWLLHFIRFQLSFTDGKLKKELRVLGIRLGGKDKGEKKKKKKKKKPKAGKERPLSEIAGIKKPPEEETEAGTGSAESAPPAETPAGESKPNDAPVKEAEAAEAAAKPDAAEEKGTQEQAENGTGQEPADASSAEETGPEAKETVPAEKDSETPAKRKETFTEFLWRIGEKAWKVLKKIAAKLRAVKKKIDKVLDKIRYYLGFAKDERTQAALSLTLKEVGKILKSLLPRKIKGYVRFGSGDVYKTGEIFAVLAAIYPVYGKSLDVYPDFMEKRIEGNVDIKGRLLVATIAGAGIKLILNKNVKYVIAFLKNKEESQNGGQ